jgi:ABC-type proline/glycine betaine transport system permease subunit
MMQTMPVFVYLIPAVIFFGMGSAPAVIATVIYAMVPVVRLTSLGIRQVDEEVVEAAKAFGSTRWQALWKVKIRRRCPPSWPV